MEKASADYTRATSNSWLAKHWKQNATPSSGYATRQRSMTKSFVASSTTSTLLKLACIDEDKSSHICGRYSTADCDLRPLSVMFSAIRSWAMSRYFHGLPPFLEAWSLACLHQET